MILTERYTEADFLDGRIAYTNGLDRFQINSFLSINGQHCCMLWQDFTVVWIEHQFSNNIQIACDLISFITIYSSDAFAAACRYMHEWSCTSPINCIQRRFCTICDVIINVCVIANQCCEINSWSRHYHSGDNIFVFNWLEHYGVNGVVVNVQ